MRPVVGEWVVSGWWLVVGFTYYRGWRLFGGGKSGWGDGCM